MVKADDDGFLSLPALTAGLQSSDGGYAMSGAYLGCSKMERFTARIAHRDADDPL